MEEEVGFEPTVRSSRTTVFKTAPINRSGTPPDHHLHDNNIFITKNINCKEGNSTKSLIKNKF